MTLASEHEGPIPDIMVLGKGVTGGHLPLVITLISEKLFLAFNDSVTDEKPLAYGHRVRKVWRFGKALIRKDAKEVTA